MKNEFALAVEQMCESERQGKGTLPVESCTGDNCGDALANFLNSGPLKDTGLALPRGGVGPGDLAGVGKARGASVLGRGDLSLDNLTPGTVIHMTRQPGDRNYEYGSTHIGIVDEDEQGNKMFKSFTAGKGWRNETINQRFIDRLPAQITATNPVNPSGGWLAKAGNLLGPSAAQAGGLPTVNNLRTGEAEDEISRVVRESSGTQIEEDEITKAVRESSGIEEVAPLPAPVVPVKPSMSGFDIPIVSHDISGSRIHGIPSAGLPAFGVKYDELGIPQESGKSVMMSDARLSELQSQSQSTNIPKSAMQDFTRQFPRLIRPKSIISARRESDPWRVPEPVRGESIWSRTPHRSIQPDPPSWGELAVSVINLQDVVKGFGVGEAETSSLQELSWRVAPDDPAIRRPPVRQEVIKADLPDLTIENIAKKFATGVIGTTGSTAEGLRWLLSDTSPALEQAKPVLAGLAKSADQYSKFLDPGDVGIIGDVASGVGSFGVFFIPGYGSATLTSKTAQFLTPRVAKVLGIGIMTAGEAMAEAGDAWAEATRYGAAKEQADLIAGRVFNFNLPLLVITERLGIFGEQGNKLRRVIASGIMEGIQETGQSMIPQIAAEKPIQYKSALYQGLIGAVIGIAAGGATSGIGGEPQRIDKFMDSVSPGNLADRAKAELVNIWKQRNPKAMGYSDEEVFERLARDPKELSDILTTAVQRTGPTIETALRKPTVEEIVANVQVVGEEAVKKADGVKEVPVVEEPKSKPLTAVEEKEHPLVIEARKYKSYSDFEEAMEAKDSPAWKYYNDELSNGYDLYTAPSPEWASKPQWENSRDKIILDKIISGEKRVGGPDMLGMPEWNKKFVNEAKKAGLEVGYDKDGNPVAGKSLDDIKSYLDNAKNGNTYDIIGLFPKGVKSLRELYNQSTLVKEAKKAKEVKVEGEVVPEPEPKPTSKPKVVPTPPERTIVETDPQTSSLRQDPEVTRVRAQVFDERAPRDILSIHAKALNDVNRWLDGDTEVSIDQVRRLLSGLAAKIEDPANDRIMLEILGTTPEVELFKEITKVSATWARRAKREISKPKVTKEAENNVSKLEHEADTLKKQYAKVIRQYGEDSPQAIELKEKVIEAQRAYEVAFDNTKEVYPKGKVEEPAPKVNNLPSIEQKLEAPGVAEGKVKELADNEAWKQAEVDAKVAEDTVLTQEAIEKYYGKSLDELSDAEVISYMNKELSGKGEGTELYSGIPVHLIGKAIRNFFSNKEELPGHEDFKLAMGAKKPDGKYQWKVLGLNSKTGKWDELSVFDTKKEARTNSVQRAVDASVEWTKKYREKMNDPLMQPEAAIAHKKAERADRNQDAMREFKEGDFTKWWDSQKKFWGEAIHDRAGRVRSALLKHFGEAGQRLLSYIESVPGGPRYGEEKARQMRKEVEAGLSKDMLKHLFDYHMYVRYTDIWKDHPKWKVPTRGNEIAPTQADVVSSLLNFKKKRGLSDAEFKLIQERSELMFEHMRNWIDDSLLASGIIGQKEAQDLKDHRYTKMKALQTWADVFDKEYVYQVGDQKTVNYDSGIQRIKGGGLSIVETDQFLVYTEIARTLFGRAANQRARQAMRDFATQFPENGMIWHKGLEGKKPKGWKKDYVFDFEASVESVETSYPARQPIWLHPDFAHQVTTVGYEMSDRFSSIVGKAFGGDLVRALAVGISPVWATIVNLPIDILHTFFSPRIFKDGKEVGKSNAEAIFSPFFPKYLAELGSNYIDVAPDVWNKGPKYQAYARYGGLLQFLTQRQSHVTGQMKRPGKFDELLDILSAHGRNTELLTRLAIMDRVVGQKAGELGIGKEELWKRENARPESEILRLATHVARENMPYGQTGWIIKALDRFIPFMGANYVGGKTFWRAAIERPADFATRISNIGAAAVGITAFSLLYNPEAWREIPDWDRERNVCIPFLSDYLKFKDSNGEKRTWHMKISGTGGPMFFYNLFSWLTHKFMYDSGMTKVQPDYSIISKSVLQNAPAQTMTPPIVSALLSYTKNMSFWQDRNIFTKLGGKVFSWPGSSVEGMNDSDVSQLAKDVGGLTGFSPKRLQGSFSEIVPTGNEFIWAFGKVYEGLFNSMPEKLMERTWQETITKSPGFKRLFGLSFPGAYRQVGDEARWKQQEAVDKRDYVRRSEFDKIMEEREKGGEVRDKLRTFYREVGREDKDARDRFMDEADQLRTIERLPNKSLWKGMLNKSNELKAMDYYERMKIESSPEEQASLRKELRILEDAGFISDDFHDELRRIRRKDKK